MTTRTRPLPPNAKSAGCRATEMPDPDWQSGPPPKDREVILLLPAREVRANWDAELKCYVLNMPIRIEVVWEAAWRLPPATEEAQDQ
jgi:hypothetical protein